ncbi:hypothetical protein J6Z39_07705 [bacterium]|nr:hypothetical protein [bacterium]
MTDFEYNNPSQSLCDSSPEVGAEKAERVLVVTTKRLLRHYQDKCEKTRVENQKTRVESEKTREKTRVKNCGENQETVEKNCGEN